jgi:hypothetical protein
MIAVWLFDHIVARLPAHLGDESFQHATAGVEIAVADDANSVRVNEVRALGVVLDSKHAMHNSATEFQVAVAEGLENVTGDSIASGRSHPAHSRH